MTKLIREKDKIKDEYLDTFRELLNKVEDDVYFAYKSFVIKPINKKSDIAPFDLINQGESEKVWTLWKEYKCQNNV